mmetsp:Transcript_113148/g.325307  ORF Transcript_113148/g.325307 Transcript_113148/m.325307 type:complete len:463 (+) Transcript_113148:92-1480(+)
MDPAELGEDLQRRGTAAYQALRLNSAQACIKSCEWLAAIEHADKVLLLDKDNAKALYRRGCAGMQLDTESRLEMARADFARVATIEPANRDVRGQLAKTKERLKDLRQTEKLRLSMAMSGGLYQEHHDRLGKQQAAYDAEVLRRSEANEDPISFEEWVKAEKEREEEEKKKRREEAERKAKEEAEQRQREAFEKEASRRRAAGEEEVDFQTWIELERLREEELRRERIGGVMQADETDLDAEELRLLRETKSKGYYHGRLGTVLSNNAPTPMQLEAQEVPPETGDSQVGSEWNQAGTWEEKDVTAWAKERLTESLQRARASAPDVPFPTGQMAQVIAKIVKVKSITGDAHIVTVRKKVKHGYHFEAELSFSVAFRTTIADTTSRTDESPANREVGKQCYTGVLALPELSDCVLPSDLRLDARWHNSGPSADLLPLANQWLDELCNVVRNQVMTFRQEYQQKR